MCFFLIFQNTRLLICTHFGENCFFLIFTSIARWFYKHIISSFRHTAPYKYHILLNAQTYKNSVIGTVFIQNPSKFFFFKLPLSPCVFLMMKFKKNWNRDGFSHSKMLAKLKFFLKKISGFLLGKYWLKLNFCQPE
jgi:hypothetical protein